MNAYPITRLRFILEGALKILQAHSGNLSVQYATEHPWLEPYVVEGGQFHSKMSEIASDPGCKISTTPTDQSEIESLRSDAKANGLKAKEWIIFRVGTQSNHISFIFQQTESLEDDFEFLSSR